MYLVYQLEQIYKSEKTCNMQMSERLGEEFPSDQLDSNPELIKDWTGDVDVSLEYLDQEGFVVELNKKVSGRWEGTLVRPGKATLKSEAITEAACAAILALKCHNLKQLTA